MHSRARTHLSSESGFTLVEVLIAAIVLSVGLVVLAFGYGQGLVSVVSAKEDTIARQKARETIESVTTALNTQNLDFANVCNTPSQGAACIFVEGFTPLYNDGADGIFGTADDAGPCTLPVWCGIQTIIDPGPDGLLGTADDIPVPLTGYQRQIVVTNPDGTTTLPLSTSLRKITVTVTYKPARALVRNVVLTTYVSPYT